MNAKKIMMDVMFRMYEPVVKRTERLKAAKMWQEGVKECEKMYKELGSPRVYLFFDTKHMVWVPMTYESNKQFRNSLRLLRMMGKLRGMASVNSVERAKEASFYYTPSRWGALGCDEDNQVKAEKLRKWVEYYVERLSEPMRKCREYRRGVAVSQPPMDERE